MVNMDPLFYPEAVAVVGASPDIVRDRAGFFGSLRECFKGRLYPVNPRHAEIQGLKCYGRVKDIPEQVDYALVMLPREKVPAVLEDCAAAKVKFVLVFTSGFSEIGDFELERKLVDIARAGGTRIVGPNCIGAHCPENGLVYYPPMMSDNPGDVAFFSQSGGHALNFLIRGLSLGVAFNKVISVGNQADLRIEDFIEYFGADERINYICGYVEDIKDGERFKKLARSIIIEKKKPFIIWKGGRSEEGARATRSHTGAMAIPVKIWDSVMGQLGVINAESQEEMADILTSLRLGFLPRGLNTCILVAGGGSSVELTDAVSLNGLSVPELSEGVQDAIGEGISRVNTSTRNPIDLGMFGFAPNIFVESAARAAEDPAIDIIMVCQYPEIVSFMVKELWEASADLIVEGLSKIKKPVVMVIPRVVHHRADVDEIRADFTRKLNAAGIPVYTSAARAARAARKIARYLDYMKRNAG